ncbi:hypothetical protein T484DRAFT_2888892 [Baffinella frigidus]|nr:hypothetical protein T484DRAFT_2888892 [Cryptophyta sp. CCMP2293]
MVLRGVLGGGGAFLRARNPMYLPEIHLGGPEIRQHRCSRRHLRGLAFAATAAKQARAFARSPAPPLRDAAATLCAPPGLLRSAGTLARHRRQGHGREGDGCKVGAEPLGAPPLPRRPRARILPPRAARRHGALDPYSGQRRAVVGVMPRLSTPGKQRGAALAARGPAPLLTSWRPASPLAPRRPAPPLAPRRPCAAPANASNSSNAPTANRLPPAGRQQGQRPAFVPLRRDDGGRAGAAVAGRVAPANGSNV